MAVSILGFPYFLRRYLIFPLIFDAYAPFIESPASRHYFITGHTGRLEKIARPEPSWAFLIFLFFGEP
jgi:hypothetical protein